MDHLSKAYVQLSDINSINRLKTNFSELAVLTSESTKEATFEIRNITLDKLMKLTQAPKKPTAASLSKKNMFTESANSMDNANVVTKLNAVTEGHVTDAKWSYYPVNPPKRLTASARLVSNNQSEIHKTVTMLNETYGIAPPLMPKRFIDPKDKATKFAIELNEVIMQKIGDKLVQNQGLSPT